jgi:hypothetical protein
MVIGSAMPSDASAGRGSGAAAEASCSPFFVLHPAPMLMMQALHTALARVVIMPVVWMSGVAWKSSCSYVLRSVDSS